MKTEDFDKAFDDGSDLIDDVVQWDKGHRPDFETKPVGETKENLQPITDHARLPVRQGCTQEE
ncbi:hypothetical protein [Endozoicomonas euniceicola]|uniref:Uncharacterized protein n=1 Tax=Endozoicomonas euniceicola TaxID=1234143 RepID=A0ABY6GQ99_9GAMM|nr:hypothetical protein [Endozoicomonas euniceicola]UYM14574.1 hypothetical protein NX720_16970 [Endozoicomonas euniceicola]